MNDPSWADQLGAWTSLANVALTLVLAALAGLAGVFTYGQLKEAKRSRESSLRPLMVLHSAHVTRGNLIVEARNIGPGPALAVRVKTWLVTVDDKPTTVTAVEELFARIDIMRNDGLPHDFDFRIGVLAAGETRTVPVENTKLDFEKFHLLVSHFDYEDVFRNAFPLTGEFTGNPVVVRVGRPASSRSF